MATLDVQIECQGSCKSKFLFSGAEAAFYDSKGYGPPKLCRPCRELKKANMRAQGLHVAEPPPSVHRGHGGGGFGGRDQDYEDLLHQYACDAREGMYGANASY